MPAQLPTNLEEFDALLRRRVRDQDAIQKLRAQAAPAWNIASTPPGKPGATAHIIGQSGCFCMDCLRHRKQDWRIGDINTAIVGPRDRWRQYAWGDNERKALGPIDAAETTTRPVPTRAVQEHIVVLDANKRRLAITRDAKFTAVASGKHHTLLLSESGGVFACGDHTYGALGRPTSSADSDPIRVELEPPMARKGVVRLIAASAFASFALVVPRSSEAKPTSDDARTDKKRGIPRATSPKPRQLGHLAEELKEKPTCNHLYSWGRGDGGVLGHGDTLASAVPRVLEQFNTMRVIQVSAGFQHVLILTDMDGVYSVGDGTDGRLGHGDTANRLSPARVTTLDSLFVVQVAAGDAHSMAVAGDSISTRQVYSWGLGANGRLGHNDTQSRAKPTRINYFRGRQVVTVVAGGAHNLALSEAAHVWSWGCGAYGQLGHRDTWDAWLPRTIDELRHERIAVVDAGERHSLALSTTQELWIWGLSSLAHDAAPIDPSSSCTVQPTKVTLPGLHVIAAKAGRGRTFVWGDRGVEEPPVRAFGGSDPAAVCCAQPEYESLSSDALRVVFSCGRCHLAQLCIACAHSCHAGHCVELGWTQDDPLARSCDCFFSGQCGFDAQRGAHELTDEDE